MAIKFQYNKISLQEMQKQLNVRLTALPVLKYKEAILRIEAEKAKKKSRGRVSIAPALFTHIKEKEFSVLNSDSDSGGRAWRHIRLNLPLSVKIFVAILQTP